MGIIAPILIVLFLFYGAVSGSISIMAIVIIFCCLYYFICLIWAIRAVDNYNQEIIAYSMSSPLNVPNNSYQSINQDSKIIEDKLSQQKREAYSDLERVKSLYDQKIISEENYIKQKESLLKGVEILSFNQNAMNTSPMQSVVYSQYASQGFVEEKRKSNLWIWILSILLILTLLYLMYDEKSNSFRLSKITDIFHSNSKDKEEIKNQIEKTYFEIMNGAYTAQTISGIGSEGLPFYNQNMTSLFAMGLAPFAQIFGGIKVESKNIDVYNFKDDNTAQVKYDLILSTNTSIDTARIDMVVKKIGGVWKLDGETFLGNKKIQNTPKEKFNKSETRNDVKPVYEIPAKLFTTFDRKYSSDEQIKGYETINSLLTPNLKNILTNGEGSIQDQYNFYKIKTISYKSFIIHFFAYRFDGIEISTTVQMNVCDTEGQIIDSKQVAKDSYDQEVDNYYDTANCILYDNGQIVIKKKSRQGNTSKERIETERYSINSNGKIVKI